LVKTIRRKGGRRRNEMRGTPHQYNLKSTLSMGGIRVDKRDHSKKGQPREKGTRKNDSDGGNILNFAGLQSFET